jgi:hypothetical protein
MALKPGERVERLVAENVSEAVWLRLKRLTSSVLCSKILSRRAPSLEAAVASKKGDETAYAVRSALGYWESNVTALNAKVLTRYYALLQISIADQVASPNSNLNLEEIQRHTEAGHGLVTLVDTQDAFPNNYKIACLKGGHLYMYCKHKGFDLNKYAFERRPRKLDTLSEEEYGRLISLADVLRRVPELQPLIQECLGSDPLSFRVGSSSRNMAEQMQRVHQHSQKTGEMLFDPPLLGDTKTTYVSIFPEEESVTKEYLDSLDLPFKNIKAASDPIKHYNYFEGELSHPKDLYWYETISLYKSGYSGTSVIVPFWGFRDPFIIHFIILYALSIVVRYLPSLWHDIEDGKLNHMRALIEHYLSIVDNVVPRLAIEMITGRRLLVVQPGSLMAPT